MILFVDNYDSFTFNLVQYFEELGSKVLVKKNDEISIQEIENLNPQAIIISPGPGVPKQAGNSLEIIKSFFKKNPILGVCLGHQALGEVFGAKLTHAPTIKHGKTSLIKHDGKSLFQGLENPLEVMRYHSFILDRNSLPACFEVSSKSEDGSIMSMRHKDYPLFGVQFHPESILTKSGKRIIKNFLDFNNLV